MSRSHQTMPEEVITKIEALAEPYATVMREHKVELTPRYLVEMDKIFKKLQKKPSRFNATFFGTWNKKMVQFNQQFAEALTQLKKDSDLKALQKLNSLVKKDLPNGILNYFDMKVLEQIDDAIYAATVTPQEEKMYALVESEMKSTLAQELKQANFTEEYFALIREENKAYEEFLRLKGLLAYEQRQQGLSIEEFVEEYNYDARYEGYEELVLRKKYGTSHWLEEVDEYENHEENATALQKYELQQVRAKENEQFYEEEVNNAYTMYEKARQIRRSSERPNPFEFVKQYEKAKKILETNDPWRQLIILLGIKYEDFIKNLIVKLEKQFKLASIKTLEPKMPEPSAPLYPVLTTDGEDEFQPGLRSYR